MNEQSSELIAPVGSESYKFAINIFRSVSAGEEFTQIQSAVINAFTQLAEHAPNPMFVPFEQGTFFYRRYAAAFKAEPFFKPTDVSNLSKPNEAVWSAFAYIYAYVFEQLLSGIEPSEIGRLIIRWGDSSNLSDLNWQTYSAVKRIKAEVTSDLAVQRQEDVRRSLETSVNESMLRMAPMYEKIGAWEDKFQKWEERSRNLQKLILDQLKDLNFVSLSKGFSKLIDQKSAELANHTKAIKTLGWITILFPFLSMGLGHFLKGDANIGLNSLTYALPLLAVELLLLYFFRISLRNQYGVKAQLLQLELRFAICAFIEGYAEFVKTARTGPEDKSLEKFESLIFSGITNDISNIPSQFDGLEQLVSILKGFKQ